MIAQSAGAWPAVEDVAAALPCLSFAFRAPLLHVLQPFGDLVGARQARGVRRRFEDDLS
ncbi:MAG: hypothetical protein HOQ29_12235, partial [Acidobacteria bacterium]|nr:hypothetical protein [Acidobacteriota bacterium]